MSREGLILKLSCPDQPRIVAKIAAYVAERRGYLVEFNQFSDTLGEKFFASSEIETADLVTYVDIFIDDFKVLGSALRAEWHFRRMPDRMRSAVLVTKTDHQHPSQLFTRLCGGEPLPSGL